MFQAIRIHARTLLFSLLLMLSLLGSGCGASGLTNPPQNGTLHKGGTWVDDLYEKPDSLIPYASGEGFSDLVDETLWAPLFVGDVAGQITPGLVAQLPTVQNGRIGEKCLKGERQAFFTM